MPKVGRSHYTDLTEPKEKQKCYKLCTLVQAARIMPCDSILKFMYEERCFKKVLMFHNKKEKRDVSGITPSSVAKGAVDNSKRLLLSTAPFATDEGIIPETSCFFLLWNMSTLKHLSSYSNSKCYTASIYLSFIEIYVLAQQCLKVRPIGTAAL